MSVEFGMTMSGPVLVVLNVYYANIMHGRGGALVFDL